jgi:hypothetical protein
MRFGPFLVPAVVGLTLLVVFGRIGESADDASSGKTTPPAKATPSPPAASFDLTQLPVGKMIGLVPGDVRVVKALDEPAEFALVDTELGEFVKQINEKHKISVQLEIAALTADGKGTETILNKTTKGTTLRSALRLLLDEQGLTFLIRDETLIITSKTAAETFTPARIYQVHDLALLPNDPSLQPRFEALKGLIQATIAPESWRDNGGTQGEIHGYEGPGLAVLVVSQTDDVHEQIERLLAELRVAKLPALFEMQKKRPPPPPVPMGTVPVVPRLPVVGGGGFSGGGFIGAGGS